MLVNEFRFRPVIDGSATVREVIYTEVADSTGKRLTVPCFYCGDGEYAYRLPLGDGGNVHDGGARYLRPQGVPFLWLGDTWWMALTDRLGFPEEFCALADDRKAKGFNVIQLVAGFYPDMAPWDPRGRSGEAGFAWTRIGKDHGEQHVVDDHEINTKFFDEMDRRIEALVERDLVPCIVGCWGYYADLLGTELIERHWHYLVARYAAYPVVWCAAGEALMPWYIKKNEEGHREQNDEEYRERMREFWTKICRQIRADDPFGRPVTIHPTEFGHEQVNDAEDVLDFNMLQTGHGSYGALLPAVRKIKRALEATGLPVVNAEACYEGICGGNEAEVQRFSFWSSILSGCCGYTYGANGVWQMNRADDPFGESPHGVTWGDGPFEEAVGFPGAVQVGGGAVFLRELPWEEFEVHPEWSARPFSADGGHEGEFCAGVSGKARVYFRPFAHGFFWNEEIICGLEAGVVYDACYFDPVDLKTFELGEVRGDLDGRWVSPRVKAFRDWVLVLRNGRMAVDL